MRVRSDAENKGRDLYIENGCVYCHSQSVRSIDWGLGGLPHCPGRGLSSGSSHIAGFGKGPVPISAQEGGEHPDDWHVAHFTNPRHTRPLSVMPVFEFLGRDMDVLIRYVQGLGLKDADARMQRQRFWKKVAVKAYEAGPEAKCQMAARASARGLAKCAQSLSHNFCRAGPGGIKFIRIFVWDATVRWETVWVRPQPHIYPPPLNFTILKSRGISGGILYYQIMNGITGTSMPYFKRELESEKIWDVGDYVANYFINESDADSEPKGIDAAWE